jgi:hypothetical protein
MRYLLLLPIALFFLTNIVSAQSKNYSIFRMEITPHVTRIPGEFSGWGGGIALEPKINVTDNIAVGLRFAETFFGGRNGIAAGHNGAEVHIGFTYMGSYGVVGEYFLTTTKVRPYGSLSFRRYAYTSLSEKVKASDSTASVSIGVRSAAKWGFEPEIGIAFTALRLSIGYNYLFGGSDIYVSEKASNSGGSIEVSERKLNYGHISFKIGFTIAGRRKK